MARYYINMNDERVVAGTAETPENVNYREIDLSWALAIRDGRATAEDVIRRINEKVGVVPYSEWTKAVSKLNVRSRDLGMERHARAASDAGDGGGGALGRFEEAKGAAKASAKSEAKGDSAKKAASAAV